MLKTAPVSNFWSVYQNSAVDELPNATIFTYPGCIALADREKNGLGS